MIEALNFVKGAVSAKDLVPALTHLAVEDGRVHGFNGRVHISAPCKQLAGRFFTAPMIEFIAAVEACQWNPHILQVEGKQVLLLRGADGKGFSATLPYGELKDFPIPDISKCKKTKLKPLLPALAALRPFVGQDATRPWSASIKFQGCIAMATNNVVLVEASLDNLFKDMALPVFAVDELLRIGIEPTHVTIEPNAAIFYYPGGAWLRTQLFEESWPDAKAILKAAHTGAVRTPIPQALAAAVQQIRPFCVDLKHPLIRLEGDTVSTLEGVTSASVGGLQGDPLARCVFHADPLTAVLSVALTADFARFPKVPWCGGTEEVPLSGVLLGLPSL